MVYRIDNRPKKHRGRYTILGIILGMCLTFGGLYAYEKYNLPVENIKETIVTQVQQSGKIIPVEINPIVHHEDKSTYQEDQKKVIQNHVISYSIDQLKQATLDDINNYRVMNGIKPIVLQNAKASQIWANHLLTEGCISHREGSVGPLQRYIDNGDQLQIVYENVSGGYGTNWSDPINAIKNADSEMINNDMDQNNAHRDNILNPNHLSVSIGLAYDSDKMIIVEDFQEPYIGQDWKSFDLAYDDSKSCW